MDLEGFTQVSQESDSQYPAKKQKKLCQLTLEEVEDMAEWLSVQQEAGVLQKG